MGLRTNPHYFGRGRLHFGAPLSSAGLVDVGDDATWGTNWPDQADAALLSGGLLRTPPGRFAGNAKALTLTPTLEQLNVPDLGETDDSDIIQDVMGSIVLLAHGARNLADVLRAAARQSTGAARTDTVATGGASLDAQSMLFTAEVIDTTLAVAVTPSWTTWQEDVHWQRDPMGVRLLQGVSGPAGSSVQIEYFTEGEAYWLEAFERPRVHMSIVYAGVNLADRTPVRVDCYRAQIRPAEDFAVISESTGEIRISFRLQPVRPPALARPRWFRVMRGNTAHA
ncbi:hypothetical protein [Variovorax sp.]|uniref:hypothetical protein n=1 Tax=Variovorax sp. TaxID=1871043 RepID=UPI003BACC3B7